MKSSDTQRVEHIKSYCVDIANTIERYGKSFEAFTTDRDYFNSVSMSILQIGELSNGLTDTFKRNNKKYVNWTAIRGMRNCFAHGYSTMDNDVIWETAISDIPALLKFCESIIGTHMSNSL